MAAKTTGLSEEPQPRMLSSDYRSLTFSLPQIPLNIINEMVYKRSKPKNRNPVKSLPEKEVVEQRKHHKRIFTEGISEISRLNFYDFSLNRENFNPSNVPDQAKYYKSKKGKHVHLSAWYGKRNLSRSKSPDRNDQAPHYGYYKQGVPGEKYLTLPTLFTPQEKSGPTVRFAPGLTPREAKEKSFIQPKIPPNTPIPQMIVNKRLSLAWGPKPEDLSLQNDVVHESHNVHPSDTRQQSKESPRVAQITLGTELPMLMNYEARQNRELRTFYPMFDNLETARENFVKAGLAKGPKKSNKDVEDLKVAKVHTQTLEFTLPETEPSTPRGESKLRSLPVKSAHGVDEHKPAVVEKTVNAESTPESKDKDTDPVPDPPPPSINGTKIDLNASDNDKKGEAEVKNDDAQAETEPQAEEGAEAVVNTESASDKGNTEAIAIVAAENVTADQEPAKVDGEVVEESGEAETAGNADGEAVKGENEGVVNTELAEENTKPQDETETAQNNDVTAEGNANNNNNSGASEQEVTEGQGQDQKDRPEVTRRISSLLEVPLTTTVNLERPPSSLCESVDEATLNEARLDVSTPEIHVSDEPNNPEED